MSLSGQVDEHDRKAKQSKAPQNNGAVAGPFTAVKGNSSVTSNDWFKRGALSCPEASIGPEDIRERGHVIGRPAIG